VPCLTDEEKEISMGVGGYARAMPADWIRRQAELVHERAKQADIVITTALIPGRAAPVLISEETVKAMKPGSVIVDLAVEQGGNCPLSELGKTVQKHGVFIVGEPNLATLVPADASALYARNVLDFLKLIVGKDDQLAIDRADEILAATLVCAGGEVLRK
jgi:NAD(P) transhydrogenase subunit alpha